MPEATSRRRRPARFLRRFPAAVGAGWLGCAVAAVVMMTVPASSSVRAAGPISDTAQVSSGVPTASPAPALRRYASVGPLFLGADTVHRCTASVIASTTHNTLITAAHCVRGDGTQIRFAPGYRNGKTPEGVWQVTGAYVLPAWQQHHRPEADYAVLTVAANRVNGKEVDVDGVAGSEYVGTAPTPGTTVTVLAYNHGSDDTPIVCAPKTYLTLGFPSFNCHGYVGGSSGSPWLTFDAHHRATVHGVIGGLRRGGCTEYRSFSAAFAEGVGTLVQRAERQDHPDTVTAPDPITC